MAKRVRIIASNPKEKTDWPLDDLIGKEFDVVTDGVAVEDDGIYISCPRDWSGYFVYHDEVEVID